MNSGLANPIPRYLVYSKALIVLAPWMLQRRACWSRRFNPLLALSWHHGATIGRDRLRRPGAGLSYCDAQFTIVRSPPLCRSTPCVRPRGWLRNIAGQAEFGHLRMTRGLFIFLTPTTMPDANARNQRHGV